MSKKKSFLIYHDQVQAVKGIPADQFKRFILAVADYSETGVEPELDSMMSALFLMFKNTIDRDLEKYEKICKRNRENGLKKKKPKKPLGSSGSQTRPNEAKKTEREKDSDTDSDTIKAFERVWSLYRRKGTKQSSLRYWKKLSESDRTAIEAKIPAYIATCSEKRYQKDFERWINPANRMWENELVGGEPEKPSYQEEQTVSNLLKGYIINGEKVR